MLNVFSDDYFMKMAIREAQQAAEEGEVPVGAVMVAQKRIIAKTYNQVERLKDVTAHAEMLAITAAASYIGGKYLHDCTLYVTLEPCPMCAAALNWAQIGKIVYGAQDEKRGFTTFDQDLLHPRTQKAFGVRHEDCSALLKDFFKRLR